MGKSSTVSSVRMARLIREWSSYSGVRTWWPSPSRETVKKDGTYTPSIRESILSNVFFAVALFFERNHRICHPGNNLFSVPDDKGIEKINQGLGIKGAGAAGNDQGKGIIPLIRVKGDTGQIKQGQNIGEIEFI